MVVGHEGVRVVSWFLGKGKGEIDAAKEWKKNVLPLPLFVRVEEDTQCRSKRHRFRFLYFIYEQ
jgi:hypothetical protein